MLDNINEIISPWFSDTLSWIIFLPVVGMFFVLAAPSRYARSITLGTTIVVFLLACSLYGPFLERSTVAYGAMEYEKSVEWISFSGGDFTINYHIGLDSLSYPLQSRQASRRCPRPEYLLPLLHAQYQMILANAQDSSA